MLSHVRPIRLVPLAFLLVIGLGVSLLSLPWSTVSGERAPLIVSLFTSVSAVCVTGLTVVDTATYWSRFGQVVIMLLIQVGGLGVMTLAAAIVLSFRQRLRMRTREALATESRAVPGLRMGNIVGRIVVLTVFVEAAVSMILTARFFFHYDQPLGEAAFNGTFHAISAFNNAGFALFSDNLVGFVGDSFILLPIAAAVIIGGLGFLVCMELVERGNRPGGWSMLTRVTVVVTLVLLTLGTVLILAAEFGNPKTLGALPVNQRWSAGFFTAVMPRTAGFNVVDVASLQPESLYSTTVQMFIGGGSGGTAGGIKVTTAGVLAAIVWAEIRGRQDVVIGRRQVPRAIQRQALAVAVLAAAILVVASATLLRLSDFSAAAVAFEAVSAFATVGLSTGITAEFSDPAQMVLIVLMYVGRIGPLVFASALAFREGTSKIRVPEERMTIG